MKGLIMAQDFTATISGNSERAETWRRILGTDTINIKSPIPSRASLPGIPNATIYELDLDVLTDDQRGRLVSHIANKFDIAIADVARDLDEIGCPILADDITVTSHNPQKWF